MQLICHTVIIVVTMAFILAMYQFAPINVTK